MPGTNLYVTTGIHGTIDLSLFLAGPSPSSTRLMTDRIAGPVQAARIATVLRLVSGLSTFDIAFSIGGQYIASFGCLIHGHVFGSDLWFRYRTIQKDVMPWASDQQDHTTTVTVGGVTYTFTITGQSSFLGYDDVAISLEQGS